MPLSRALYSSFALAPVNENLLDIVRSAEAKNALSGISGMLFFCDQGYVQILEGETHIVRSLLSKIGTDARHHVRWSVVEDIDDRSISTNLPMGYCDPSDCPADIMVFDQSMAPLAKTLLVDIAHQKYPQASHIASATGTSSASA